MYDCLNRSALCIVDKAGILTEKRLKLRLQQAFRASGDLSVLQHGFRREYYIIGAISEVIEAVKRVETTCQAQPLVLLVTFDVLLSSKEFNSARCCDMLEALERIFPVPPYI